MTSHNAHHNYQPYHLFHWRLFVTIAYITFPFPFFFFFTLLYSSHYTLIFRYACPRMEEKERECTKYTNRVSSALHITIRSGSIQTRHSEWKTQWYNENSKHGKSTSPVTNTVTQTSTCEHIQVDACCHFTQAFFVC